MQIREAVQVLLEHDISGAPVVDEQDQLVGMLTERDCMDVVLNSSYFDEPGGRVAQYMSKSLECVEPDTTLMAMAKKFRDSSYRRFPVVENNTMIGIISRVDILRILQNSAWFDRPG
jgi:CBS domain-containing protein